MRNAAFLALALLASTPAFAAPLPCPDDGRLKGVEIGSPLFRQTVFALPGHACVTSGPNGVFIVRPDGLKKIGK
jgi:hypothetical protein